jgi:hypothetical protein
VRGLSVSIPLVQRLAVVAVLAGLLLAAWTVATAKGVWFDELFSIYEARHHAPFADMFWRHWMVDGHPPLFNMSNWAMQPLVGDDIVARRALNLLPLALAGMALIEIARRYVEARAFLFVFALLMLASPVALEQIVEHRANFAQLAAMSVAVAVFAAIGLAGRDFGETDRPVALILFLALLVAFNLHYIGALSAGFVTGIFIAASWIAGRPRWTAIMLGLAAVAAIPLAASIAAQSLLLAGYTRDFWITTDSATAVKTFLDLFMGGAKANIVVTGIAVFALGTAALRRNPADYRPQIEVAATCLIAALLVCAALFVVNMNRPIILLRYLVTEVPLIAAALAVLGADLMVRKRWLILASTLAALLTLSLFTQRLSAQQNWFASARIVADVVRGCPSAAVHTPIEWSRDFTDDGPDYAAVMRYGYETVGRRFGFVVEPAASQRVDPNCPTLVWVEHFHRTVPGIAEAAHGLPIAPAAISGASIERTRSGFVVTYPPPKPEKSPAR